MQQGCVLFCSLIIVQMLAWPLRTPHMFVLKLGLCVGWQSRISVIRSWFYPADPCFNQDDQLRSRVVSELRWYNTSLQTTFCSLCESDHLLLTSNFKQFTQTSHQQLICCPSRWQFREIFVEMHRDFESRLNLNQSTLQVCFFWQKAKQCCLIRVIIEILQSINYLWKNLNLILTPKYGLHKQTRPSARRKVFHYVWPIQGQGGTLGGNCCVSSAKTRI